MEQLVPTTPDALVSASSPDQFVALAHRQPFLEPEQERAAVDAWCLHRDRQAAELLIRAHLRLVVAVARKYRRQWPDWMDLIQQGNLGLLEALYRFDPRHGARFGTYAGYWVRATIIKFLMDNWSLVRIGRTKAGRKLFFQLERERSALSARGIEPTAEAIAHRLDLDVDAVERATQRLDGTDLSLDAPSETGTALVDRLEGLEDSPEAQAARRQVAQLAGAIMDRFAAGLTGREADIWHLRLAADDPLSLSELGDRFGVSKQRVAQLERSMKQRLRRLVERELGADSTID